MDFPTLSDLDGRIAVVTGASSGIGAAVARRLAGHGARVAVVPLAAADVAAVVACAVSAPPGVNIAHVSVAPTRLA